MESKEWKGNIAEESTDHVYDPLQQQKPKDSASTLYTYISYHAVYISARDHKFYM